MKKIVLIIDDDPIIRMIIKKMINIVDHSVDCHACENGEIGLSSLINMQGLEGNIIVLLDINMPVLDGWGFLDELQKVNIANIDNIQFYIVSSSTDDIDKLKSQTYPVIKKFYNKPLSRQDIIDILNTGVTT